MNEEQEKMIAEIRAAVRRMKKELFWIGVIERLSPTMRPLIFIGVVAGIYLDDFIVPIWVFGFTAIQLVSISVIVNKNRFGDLNYLRASALGAASGIVTIPVFTADMVQFLLSCF